MGLRQMFGKWRERRRAEKTLLTRLVKRQAGSLSHFGKITYEIWRHEKRIEFLPGGIPYKVSSALQIRQAVGTFVQGVNKPLILVSDLLNEPERRNAAGHELIEWQRRRPAEDSKVSDERDSHRDAVRMTNPRLARSARERK